MANERALVRRLLDEKLSPRTKKKLRESYERQTGRPAELVMEEFKPQKLAEKEFKAEKLTGPGRELERLEKRKKKRQLLEQMDSE